MRSTRAVAVAVGLALLLALPALGQGLPTGKLTGKVTSEGQNLPGVTVTVNSPNLQGSRTAVTSENGDYNFPSLPAGEYRVTFELSGLQTVEETLLISASQSVRLDAEMVVGEVITETIEVTGTSGSLESISENTQNATTYTKSLVDNLPAGRTLTQIVAMAPGVQPNGPSKNEDTGLSNITVSGAPTFENLFMINGVVMNENIRGQAFDLFIEDAIQETTTISSGVSAEYGRFSGGVINVITKSGGNDFSGSFRTGFRNQDWEEETPLTTVQTDEVIPTYELTFGGPILRDRLWFFVAGRDREAEVTRNTAQPVGAAYTNVRDQQRYEGKLTATLTPRHTLVGTYAEIEDVELGNAFTGIMDRDSLNDRETPQELWALNYTGVITDSLFVSAQYSEREFTFIGSGAKTRDLIGGTLILDNARGTRYHSPTFCGICTPEERDNTNLVLKASYFLSTDSLGSHDFAIGYDTFEDIRVANNHQSGSDWRILGTTSIIRGEEIFPVFLPGSTFMQFDPVLRFSEGTSFVTDSYFVNDAWRLNDRVTFNLGLRYDVNDGVDAAGQSVADDSKISPRLGASFDTMRDGRLVLYASYGNYVAALANSVGDSGSPGGVPSAFQWFYRGPAINADPNAASLVDQNEALRLVFDWFAGVNGGLPTTDNPLGGGQQALRAVALRGIAQRVGDSLKSPSVVEYSIGAATRLGNRGLARIDFVHRDWEDFYSARTDTSTGQITAQLGTVVQRFDFTLVGTNDSLYERTYDGLHSQFRYRFGERLDVGGNWTLSWTEGNVDGENQASGPLLGGFEAYPEYRDLAWSAPEGYLFIDQRHRVNVYGVWRALDMDRQTLNVGLVQTYQSGHPYSEAGTISLLSTVGVASTNFVTNPGYLTPPTSQTYFFSDRGEYTTPDVTRTNISLDYGFRIGAVELFAHPEVINVFNEDNIDTTDPRYFNTSVLTAQNGAACSGSPTGRCLTFNPFTDTPVENVHWVRGANFGKAVNPLAFQQPRTYLFSVGLRF